MGLGSAHENHFLWLIEIVMSYKYSAAVSLVALCLAGCQDALPTQEESAAVSADVTKISGQVVEASCGECQFDLPGNGCNLAVRIDGQAYYVDGSSLDDHGDAHGKDGMCNCVRQARVTGTIQDGRFVSTNFEMLPFDAEKYEADQQESLKKSRLGASFAMKGKADLFIHEIWNEGPAAQAGLQKGDQILKLGGKAISELNAESIKSILGESSSISFSVKRGDELLELTIEL